MTWSLIRCSYNQTRLTFLQSWKCHWFEQTVIQAEIWTELVFQFPRLAFCYEKRSQWLWTWMSIMSWGRTSSFFFSIFLELVIKAYCVQRSRHFFFLSFTLQWLQRPDVPVQIRGRYQTTVFDDKLFVGSAVSTEEGQLSAIFYTVDLEQWHEVKPPPHTQHVHDLFSHGGKLYCAAEFQYEFNRFGRVVIYRLIDLSTGTWVSVQNGRLPHQQFDFACSVFNDCAWFIGGWDLHQFVTTVTVFDLVSFQWLDRSQVPTLPEAVCAGQVVQYDDQLHLVGGVTGSRVLGNWRPNSKVFSVRPLSGANAEWCEGVLECTPSGNCACCRVDDSVVVAGGGTPGNLVRDVFSSQPGHPCTWARMPSLCFERADAVLVVYRDHLVCVGGYDNKRETHQHSPNTQPDVIKTMMSYILWPSHLSIREQLV